MEDIDKLKDFVLESFKEYIQECEKRFEHVGDDMSEELLTMFFSSPIEDIEDFVPDNLLELRSMNVVNKVIDGIEYKLTMRLYILTDYDNPYTRFIYFFVDSFELKNLNDSTIIDYPQLPSYINTSMIVSSFC